MSKLKDYFEAKRAEAEKLYQQELDRLANVDIDEVKIPKEIKKEVDPDEEYENSRDNELAFS